MFLLVGHGIVSENNCSAWGTQRLRLSSSAKRGLQGAMRPVEVPAQFAASRPRRQIQTFDCNDMQRALFRVSFQFIVQKNGFRNFFHRLPRLLALSLQRAVGFFLVDFHFTLQNALGALHQFSGF